MKHRVISAIASISFALVAWPARADVAPPPLESVTCPRGAVARLPEVPAGATDARGRPLRAWPYCGPSVCTSDADCSGGMTCSAEEIGLCVESVTRVPGGEPVRSVRERPCEPNGTCLNINSTCERARRCVRDGGASAGSTTSTATAAAASTASGPSASGDPAAPVEASAAGCGCRAATGSAAGSPASVPLSIALLLGLVALRRRR